MSEQLILIFVLLYIILIALMQLLKAKKIESSMKEKLASKKSFISRILEFNVALDKLNDETRYSYYSAKDERLSREEKYYGVTAEVSMEITNDEEKLEQYQSDIDELMEIPGVGKTIAIRLIEVFGSLVDIKKSKIVDLTSVQSIGIELAQRIGKHLEMEI